MKQIIEYFAKANTDEDGRLALAPDFLEVLMSNTMPEVLTEEAKVALEFRSGRLHSKVAKAIWTRARHKLNDVEVWSSCVDSCGYTYDLLRVAGEAHWGKMLTAGLETDAWAAKIDILAAVQQLEPALQKDWTTFAESGVWRSSYAPAVYALAGILNGNVVLTDRTKEATND